MTAPTHPEACRRQQLLEAAARLVVHRGPNRTTVADIAKAAGVAVGSVYLEFAGKSEILGALSDHQLQQVLATMRAAAVPRPHRSPAAAVAERVCDALETRTQALRTHLTDDPHPQSLLRCTCDGVEAAWRRFEAATYDLLVEILSDLPAPARPTMPGDTPAPPGADGTPASWADAGASPTPADEDASPTPANEDAVPAPALARALLRAYADFVPPRLCALEPTDLAAELRALRRLVQHGLCPRP